nr:hypothetical protein HK105_005771 [Polyrhizophydium stewartii]
MDVDLPATDPAAPEIPPDIKAQAARRRQRIMHRRISKRPGDQGDIGADLATLMAVIATNIGAHQHAMVVATAAHPQPQDHDLAHQPAAPPAALLRLAASPTPPALITVRDGLLSPRSPGSPSSPVASGAARPLPLLPPRAQQPSPPTTDMDLPFFEAHHTATLRGEAGQLPVAARFRAL